MTQLTPVFKAGDSPQWVPRDLLCFLHVDGSPCHPCHSQFLAFMVLQPLHVAKRDWPRQPLRAVGKEVSCEGSSGGTPCDVSNLGLRPHPQATWSRSGPRPHSEVAGPVCSEWASGVWGWGAGDWSTLCIFSATM